ncbi:hypothetical protein GCM10010917_20290 [Paenibacillus physcomitrellae]|uniref:Uncharacterized protein n=1 Tax=Paenibacillus physcomitrellae TaxID=1619311 RepID=A0ABQ1G134_9BACL|nr:hypothetical protein GCM10010917_20290 [Paenibacillus physcomitrellae]
MPGGYHHADRWQNDQVQKAQMGQPPCLGKLAAQTEIERRLEVRRGLEIGRWRLEAGRRYTPEGN